MEEISDVPFVLGWRTAYTNCHHNSAPEAVSYNLDSVNRIYKLICHLESYKLICHLWSQGVISKTCLLFNNPIWPVWKSNGEWRLTVNNCGWNEVAPPLSPGVLDILQLPYELESKTATWCHSWYCYCVFIHPFDNRVQATVCSLFGTVSIVPGIHCRWETQLYHLPQTDEDWNKVELWSTCNVLVIPFCEKIQQKKFLSKGSK